RPGGGAAAIGAPIVFPGRKFPKFAGSDAKVWLRPAKSAEPAIAPNKAVLVELDITRPPLLAPHSMSPTQSPRTALAPRSAFRSARFWRRASVALGLQLAAHHEREADDNDARE